VTGNIDELDSGINALQSCITNKWHSERMTSKIFVEQPDQPHTMVTINSLAFHHAFADVKEVGLQWH